MSRRLLACIWPSRPARDQALAREARQAPGGLLLAPAWYTMEEFLPLVLDQVELPPGWEALDHVAGPMLVQGLIQDEQAESDIYHGMAAGRRLPRRLWRLLLELKAAGITAPVLAQPAQSGGRRLRALARLLERYDQALADLKLADQADRLSRLEEMLAQGRVPSLLRDWAGLRAREVLWLRPLDLRLFRALSRHMPLEVDFYLAPDRGGFASLHGLAGYTEQALMKEGSDSMELRWLDPAEAPGPLAGFIGSWLRGEPPPDQAPPGLELVRAPGRYAEVEEMVSRALGLCRQGVPPHRLALVFPDLAIYDQMALNAARRLGLPLRPAQGRPLVNEPLVQDFLDLLELPLGGYARGDLARVLGSPYLAGPLGRLFTDSGQPLGPEAGRLLSQAGYVDGREEGPGQWLARRSGDNRAMAELAGTLQNIQAKLEEIFQSSNLTDYINKVISLGQDLGLDETHPEHQADPHLAARDLDSAHGLMAVLQDLALAAGQLDRGPQPELSPARLAALLREALGSAQTRTGQGVPGGVHLLRLDQTLGLELHTVLVGGLNQGRFPRRSPGQHLVSRQDRLALGKLAGMPVWRTEEEDYGGQLLRLMRLLANSRAGAVLSHPAADQQGREQEASLFFLELEDRLGHRARDLEAGGVFGQAPPLDRCQDPLSLWTRLAGQVLRPGGDEVSLARAVLHHLLRRTGAPDRWADLVARAGLETGRHQEPGPYGGRLESGPALGLLARVLEGHRRLSPSSLESYAACPLAWFFNYILGLDMEAEPGWDMERSLEGQWVHRTLALFFDPRDFDPHWDQAERQRRLGQCLERARHMLGPDTGSGHGLVWQARRRFLQDVLATVVEQEWAALAGGRPLAVEMRLGPRGRGLALELADGQSITITGRLDRLDRQGNELVVTDYKHSDDATLLRRAVKREDLGITAFQVPLYLAAVQDQAEAGVKVLRGRLLSTRRPSHKPRDIAFSVADPYLERDPAKRARLADKKEDNIFNQVAQVWQDMTSGEFAPRPDGGGCSYCAFFNPCRAVREAGS